MKRALLSFVLVFAAFALYGQCGGFGDCGTDQHGDRTNYGTQNNYASVNQPDVDFMLYPNPTVDFIQIDDKSVDAGLAKYMRIYSLTGQMVKSFYIAKGNSYNVSDLKAGTYLVQFVNWKKKVVATKRINKSEGL